MPTPPYIEPGLLALLQSYATTPFTTAELLGAYRALPGTETRSAKNTRQFVQRNVARLTAKGVLRRLDDNPEGEANYQWAGPTTDHDGAPNAASAELTHTLQDKLRHYRVELLTALGETEEYDALCAELPHLRDNVQALYNEARDRSSKILGRVRALESLLAAHSASAA